MQFLHHWPVGCALLCLHSEGSIHSLLKLALNDLGITCFNVLCKNIEPSEESLHTTEMSKQLCAL